MNTSGKTIVVCVLALSLLVSGCGPGQVFGPTITPTFTPTLTSTPTSTQIPPTPTFTSTPTPTPGPELIVYLPTTADLPQCKWIEYSVSLRSASLWCNLPGNINLNADVTVQDKLLTQTDLSIYNPIATVTVPMIGQGAIAAEVAEGGKDIVLVFYKGNTSIRIENYNPRGKANLENVVALAQQVEKLIPDQIVPPAMLSFPDKLNEEIFQKYFRAIDFKIMDQGGQIIDKYTENSMITIEDYPKNISRERYVVGLYNVQTQMIEWKTYYEMIGYKHGGGGPSYPQGKFKAGDKYELRIAVGDTLVAVYPFETK